MNNPCISYLQKLSSKKFIRMTQIPDGKKSKQIETNLKRLIGVRLEGSQESKRKPEQDCDTLQKAKRDATYISMGSLRWREMIT
jgi:hypothetical protein